MLNGQNSILGFAGTPDYLAPEVLRNKKITKASDWWTFGILLYEMLFGRSPFYHEDHKQMFRGILGGTPVFPSKLNVSNEAIDLIMSLLRKKPEKRLGQFDALKILQHPFFKGINLDNLLKKRQMAPMLPNIEMESSLENFANKFTRNPLVLSFEGNNSNDKCSKKSSTGELLDFSFVEEEFVETAMHDSIELKSYNCKTRKFWMSDNLKN